MVDALNSHQFHGYIRILYLPAGHRVTVDFDEYTGRQPGVFFITNQHLTVHAIGEGTGFFIYYNRDFYCIQIHDAEVACDGLLFNNSYQMPLTALSADENQVAAYLFQQMEEEFELNASSQEEMLRVYLKQLIIRATRIWKKQQLGKLNDEPHRETEFFREFSRLVEIHYKRKHSVSEYADLMGVAAKTLSNKFRRFDLPQPNDVIKDRIILEAKRLLSHTALSVKEIAYDLGYDDPAYFNRLFTSKVGNSPAIFKKNYQ